MKTQHISLMLVASATVLLAGCPGSTDQGNVKQDSLSQSNSQTRQSFVLSADQQKNSNDRAVQDTLGWHEGCESCSACDNSTRWTGTASRGGVELTPDEARNRVQSFHSDHPDMIC